MTPPRRAAAIAVGVVSLAVLAAGGGCAARQTPPDQPLIDTTDPEAAPGATADDTPPAATSPAPVPIPRRRTGRIARGDLDRVLQAGPGAFLATVEVHAHLVAGSFAGWEVVRCPYPDLDLVPGDVVLSVNGHTLEHPLDLEALWHELARAPAIQVEVSRAGQRFALSFKVVTK